MVISPDVLYLQEKRHAITIRMMHDPITEHVRLVHRRARDAGIRRRTLQPMDGSLQPVDQEPDVPNFQPRDRTPPAFSSNSFLGGVSQL